MCQYELTIYMESKRLSVAVSGLELAQDNQDTSRWTLRDGSRGKKECGPKGGGGMCRERDCWMEGYMGRGTNGREGRERD